MAYDRLVKWRGEVKSVAALDTTSLAATRFGPLARGHFPWPDKLLDSMRKGMLRRLSLEVGREWPRCEEYLQGSAALEELRRFPEDLALLLGILERDNYATSLHQREAADEVLERIGTTLRSAIDLLGDEGAAG